TPLRYQAVICAAASGMAKMVSSWPHSPFPDAIENAVLGNTYSARHVAPAAAIARDGSVTAATRVGRRAHANENSATMAKGAPSPAERPEPLMGQNSAVLTMSV